MLLTMTEHNNNLLQVLADTDRQRLRLYFVLPIGTRFTSYYKCLVCDSALQFSLLPRRLLAALSMSGFSPRLRLDPRDCFFAALRTDSSTLVLMFFRSSSTYNSSSSSASTFSIPWESSFNISRAAATAASASPCLRWPRRGLVAKSDLEPFEPRFCFPADVVDFFGLLDFAAVLLALGESTGGGFTSNVGRLAPDRGVLQRGRAR